MIVLQKTNFYLFFYISFQKKIPNIERAREKEEEQKVEKEETPRLRLYTKVKT